MKFIACKPSATCFIAGLLSMGCSSQKVETVGVNETHPFRVVEADSATAGNDRLVLKEREYDFGAGADFHSIVWQRNKNGEWGTHLEIDKSDFQQDGRFPWVISIHSFYPTKATAVFKVGELGPPDNTGTETATYSWREWDLNSNKEIRIIELDSETTVDACPMLCVEPLKRSGPCPVCEMQLQPTLGSVPPKDN